MEQSRIVADSITQYKRITEIMDFRRGMKMHNNSKERFFQKGLIEKEFGNVFTDIAKHHGLVFYMSL